MRGIIVTAFLLCVFSGSVWADASENFDKAGEAYNDGNYQLAIDWYTKAIKSAEKAVQLNDIASFHDTLAAAYAEAGQYSDAAREIERAIEMARAEGDTDDVAEYESRLNLYRQNEPYHEAPQ